MTQAVSHPEVSHSDSYATAPLWEGIRQAGRRLGIWLEAFIAATETAALYERLSRLSDPELHRRGLSRSTLVRDVVNRTSSGS
jgi:hypothetical protein